MMRACKEYEFCSRKPNQRPFHAMHAHGLHVPLCSAAKPKKTAMVAAIWQDKRWPRRSVSAPPAGANTPSQYMSEVQLPASMSLMPNRSARNSG
eukprot:3120154-Prymnesium_polylepis.1